MRHLRTAQLVLVIFGGVVASFGVALIYKPAGLIVAGVGTVLYGFFLVDDGEDVLEPRAARPTRPQH